MRSPLLAAAVCAALVSSSNAQVSGARPAVKTTPVRSLTPSTTLPPAPLVGGSDDCSTAAAMNAITGPNTYNVDTTVATSGAPIGSCGAIGSDVWFYYTATSTGTVLLSTCGGSMDSVLAVWADGSPAGTCPTTQIVCLDDSCGLETTVSFAATTGQKFFLELGGYASQTYVGTFTVTECGGSSGGGCTAIDDGTTENSVGLTAGGAIGWLVGFGTPAQNTTISSVSTCYGTPLFPNPMTATTVTVAVWDDPNDDGDPTDCVLLGMATATVSAGSVNTDVFQTVNLTSPVTANGIFFVGATVTTPAGQYAAPLDQSGGSACSAGLEWIFGDGSGTANLTTLSANALPPTLNSGVGLPGNWLLRVGCATSPGISFCPGDGSGTACPCGNNAVAGTGTGCLSSLGVGGLLAATGGASVANDTVSLNGSQMPATGSCLYFQGTTQLAGGAGAAFGDGLRCAGGTVVRLGTKTNVGGASAYPGGGTSVSVKGGVAAGNVRQYQCWYRNAAVFCTSSTFNLTNGIQITWAP